MSRYVRFEDTGVGYDSETFTLTDKAHVIDAKAEDLKADNGNIYQTTAHNRHMRRHFKGPRMWEGSMDTLLYTKGAPTLLYYAMGKNTTTPGTDVKIHALETADKIPNFIAEIGRDIKAHRYNGCTLNGFSIDFDPAEAISANYDIMARKEIETVDVPTTLPTLPDYDVVERGWGGVEFDTFIGDGGIDTTTSEIDTSKVKLPILTGVFDYVEKMSLKFDNSFDKNNVLGDQYNKRNFVQDVGVTGTFDFGYDDSIQSKQNYTDVIEQNDKSFVFRAIRGFDEANGVYTEADGNTRMICFKLPRVSYDTSNIPTTNNERYVQSIDWTAQTSSPTIQQEIYVEVINAEDSSEFTA